MFLNVKFHIIFYGFTFLLGVGLPSCLKEEISCGGDITITNPYVVNEGEDLIFTIDGLENTGIDAFYWECPDMSPYNILTEGRVYASSNQFVIPDFNVRDVGEYNVKMYPKDESCAAVILERNVTMEPKTCPCATPALENTLYYSPSYEGTFTEETMTALIYNSNTEEGSSITFSETNTLKLLFGRKLPENSSTFNIVEGQFTYWDEDNNDYLDVQLAFSAQNHGYSYFGIHEMDGGFYLQRSGNILTMQFCDLEIHDYTNVVFTISGKFSVSL